MNKWPKSVQLENNDSIATLIEEYDDSAEYMVFNGAWQFTVERYFGQYYITAVDGYTKGRIAESLLGNEAHEMKNGELL